MLKLEEVPVATRQSREEGSMLLSQAHTKGRLLHVCARRHTGRDMNTTAILQQRTAVCNLN